MDMQRQLSIEGMTCGHCVKKVEKIIGRFQGVSDIAVSLEQREAVFSCDPAKTDMQGIIAAINDFGYNASEK
jgi:copper chaperone